MLDEEKLAQLPTTNQLLDEKYGKEGTPSRDEFDAKALAWYYGTFCIKKKVTQRGSKG